MQVKDAIQTRLRAQTVSVVESILSHSQMEGFNGSLVVVGEHDPGTPVSAAEVIHVSIASSKLKIIPDAAHFVNVEKAGVFNGVLLEFLKHNVA